MGAVVTRDHRPQVRLERARAGADREPPKLETPEGYVDATIIMTGLLRPPFASSKTMSGEAQIFRITLQAFGRRVAERLMVEVLIAGASLSRFPAMPILGAGYSTTQISPYYVRKGEIVTVLTKLTPRGGWWRRLVDRFWDWWEPPKVRVILTGVVKGDEPSEVA